LNKDTHQRFKEKWVSTFVSSLAIWAVDLLRHLDLDRIPRLDEIQLDVRVLGFALLTSLVTGVAVGIVPALMATRTDVCERIRAFGASLENPRANWFRSTLVIVEIAMAQMLLVALPHDIFRLVVGKGLLMVFTGVILGLALSLIVTRFLASLLFGISAYDALAYASGALLLGATGAGSCYIPTQRALKVDPIATLRNE